MQRYWSAILFAVCFILLLLSGCAGLGGIDFAEVNSELCAEQGRACEQIEEHAIPACEAYGVDAEVIRYLRLSCDVWGLYCQLVEPVEDDSVVTE